jgi:hypothetical protein
MDTIKVADAKAAAMLGSISGHSTFSLIRGDFLERFQLSVNPVKKLALLTRYSRSFISLEKPKT